METNTTNQSPVVNKDKRVCCSRCASSCCCRTRKRKIVTAVVIVVCVLGLAGGLGYFAYTKGRGFVLPYVRPPVASTIPSNYKSSTDFSSLSLDASQVQSRFFPTSGGPTDLYALLNSIDTRLSSINSNMYGQACLYQTNVEYTVSTWGTDTKFYAQCYSSWNGGFTQFGVKNGKTYLYQYGGQSRSAVIISNSTLPDGTASHSVYAWLSVGVLNSPWDTMSYGVMILRADPSQGIFEMSIAGIGLGYCGAQLISNSTNLYVIGSTDMGSTCSATDSVCVLTSDTATPSDCGYLKTLITLPAIGRQYSASSGSSIATSWAASDYPSNTTDQVVLTGAATDSVFFGPTSPTSGTGKF